jgi:hypothetical protein
VREASLPAPKSDVVGAPSLPDTVAPAGVPQTETPFVMLPPPRPVPAPDGPPRTLAPPAEAQFESAEEGSRAFAYSYLQSWSSSNDKALSDLRGLFGSRVSYYGRSLDQNSLFEKKRRFAERWPVRNYRHRPGTLSVRCEKPAGQCWVRSIVDWDAANPTRNAKKRGAFRFELGIDVSGPRPIVRSENMPQLANLAPKPAPAEARGAARPRPEPSVKGQPLQLPGALLPDDTISDEGDDETTLLEN